MLHALIMNGFTDTMLQLSFPEVFRAHGCGLSATGGAMLQVATSIRQLGLTRLPQQPGRQVHELPRLLQRPLPHHLSPIPPTQPMVSWM